MKHYRFNQIAMAVLGALLLFFGTKTLINIAYEEHEPEKPGLEVAGGEEQPGGGEAKPGGGGELATLLASADPAKGAEVAKKCAICHSFDKGGPNMIGPDLYGVLGRKIASHEGYEYSDALKAKSGEEWTYENVNHMIENPNAFAPGTKMALFPGLPDAKQRADVIAFLRTKNDNPPPLPEVSHRRKAGAAKRSRAAKRSGRGSRDAAFLALVAKADPKQGEADAALCKVCHSFQKGGPAIVGPDLYGVVGRKIASVEGFNYTPALKAHEGDWTYSNLDVWLKNPQAFAPGTAMVFPGVADDKKRANIVAFLRANADTPAPLPEAARRRKPPEDRSLRPRKQHPPPRKPRLRPRKLRLRPRKPHLRPRKPRLLLRRQPRRRPRSPPLPRKHRRPSPKPLPHRNRRHLRTRHRPRPPRSPRRPETMRLRRSRPQLRSRRRASRPSPTSRSRSIPRETSEDMSDRDMPVGGAASSGEKPFANQPQPVYPDGPPEGAE